MEPPAQLTAKAGAEVTETLQVTVQPGFHVNTDKPKGEFLIPLKLTWTGDALETESTKFPKGEEIEVGPDRLVVFTGVFPIETRFKVSPRAAKGPALMTGKLSYQACNNQMCFRPATTEVRLPVVVQ